MRGDLQEGQVYGKRLCGYASRCQLPLFPSTKSRFLCFFGLRNPHFLASRAQNRGFCALLPFGTPVFGCFEHKIGIFVLGVAPAALSQMTLVQFYRWGDAAAEALNRWDDSLWDRCQWAAGRRQLGEDRWDDSRWAKAAADVGALGRFEHKKEDDRAVTLSEISERYCNPFYSSYSSLLRRSC